MNDLISRKALCEYAINTIDKTVSPNDIMRFPSADPERWISVTERLPEDGERVLTTIEVGSRGNRVMSGTYFKSLFHCDNGNVWTVTDKEVIAWMPLPKPWENNNE